MDGDFGRTYSVEAHCWDQSFASQSIMSSGAGKTTCLDGASAGLLAVPTQRRTTYKLQDIKDAVSRLSNLFSCLDELRPLDTEPTTTRESFM